MAFYVKAASAAALSFVFLFSAYGEVFAMESYTVLPVQKTATYRFNNDNWFTLPHPKVATFTIRDDGSAYGVTVDNIPFTQDNVPNTLGIRIQRFAIQDHYHYIIDGKEAYTSEDLSIALGNILRARGSLSV